MGKYDPLEKYLTRKRDREIELSFADIARIIGGMLPDSAQRPQWWANEVSADSRHVQSRAWLNAGYDASLLPAERVRFTRRMLKIPVEGDPNTSWIIPEQPRDGEIAEGKRALGNLVKSLARAAADACHKHGLEFDMDDPEVARAVMMVTFKGLLLSPSPQRRAPGKRIG